MAYGSLKISPRVLRRLIDAAGYNFSEFSRDVGISKEAMRGYTDLSLSFATIKPEYLRKIAEKLKVSPDVLRVNDESPVPSPADRLAELRVHILRTGIPIEDVIADLQALASKVERARADANDVKSAQDAVNKKRKNPQASSLKPAG